MHDAETGEDHCAEFFFLEVGIGFGMLQLYLLTFRFQILFPGSALPSQKLRRKCNVYPIHVYVFDKTTFSFVFLYCFSIKF